MHAVAGVHFHHVMLSKLTHLIYLHDMFRKNNFSIIISTVITISSLVSCDDMDCCNCGQDCYNCCDDINDCPNDGK